MKFKEAGKKPRTELTNVKSRNCKKYIQLYLQSRTTVLDIFIVILKREKQGEAYRERNLGKP